jgi:hypothetical protein
MHAIMVCRREGGGHKKFGLASWKFVVIIVLERIGRIIISLNLAQTSTNIIG